MTEEAFASSVCVNAHVFVQNWRTTLLVMP
jgi:hypothetical protein